MTSVPTARVTLRLIDTAALGTAARADHRQHTHDHVPGSVLRGALAAAWLRTPGLRDDVAFRAAFEGDGSFGPLHSAASRPIPLSVHLHKRAPTPACNRWWWDAVDAAPPMHCPECGSPLVASTGRPVGRPALVARTRTALDRAGVAADQQLYRRAALSSDTGDLVGWVSGPAVAALTPGGRTVTRLRVGGELSLRGAADVAVEPAAPPPLEAVGTRIVLRLSAPGVFVRGGHPTDRPDPSELADVLGTRTKIVQSWTRWTVVGGWHLASGLPKPQDRAVVAGSTYLVECTETPAQQNLARLAARGLGLRRREGCGALGPRPDQQVAASPLLAAISPVIDWLGWAAHAAALRDATWPVTAESPRYRVEDANLTVAQRTALRRLHQLTDPDLARTVLDHLDTP